ncbi:MAG TPA: peptidoglycan DD-metalloendopeptidase family protein [Ramlibacter sp.]|nr:peptidoglycan DD-metalloendopeptidase family protein [Ramlibacter sp.]
MLELRNWRSVVACVVAAGVLAGCGSRGPRTPAPVEDRSSGARAPAQAAPVAVEPSKGPVDNAGKPGYYTVRSGDTLIRIALDAGQNWRDIARWNNLDNPNVIEVGQVLRVTPPGATEVARNATANTSTATAPRGTALQPATPASAAASSSTSVASIPPASTAPLGPPAEDDLPWSWPIASAGSVLAGFDEQKNKGLDIGGKAGDPVLAAADGRVVYAGAGLRGYGNLIILKHNNTYLSAYAHNQSLLVKEDQAVRKGQKIAEMGNSDADRVKLHFEIRRQGKPVDPARYLPMR